LCELPCNFLIHLRRPLLDLVSCDEFGHGWHWRGQSCRETAKKLKARLLGVVVAEQPQIVAAGRLRHMKLPGCCPEH